IEIVPEDCTDPEQLAVDRTRLPGEATLLALDPESGEVRWRVLIGGEGLSAPTGGQETIYVVSPAGGFNGMLRAFDSATGAERWRFVTGRLRTLRPGVGQGLVYLSLAGMEGDGGAEVVAVNSETGTERWRRKVGGEANPPPLLRGDVLYVGTDHPRLLLALEAGTGEVLWQTDLPGPVPGTPASGSGLLFVAVPLFADVSGEAEDRSEVIALDPETGGIRWSQTVPGVVSGSPAVANGDVYLGLRDFSTGTGTLIALSAETGEERWRFTSEGEIAASPTVAEDLVLVADRPSDRSSNLYAVDAHSGEEQWRGALAGEVAEPAAVEGQVLYLSDRRGLSALELETGQERWRLEVTAAGFSGGLTAPTLHERLLYVGQS
ncbi:MAG: PQQ-binding-like beta-propeller repeat protein, partial [Acidimicrobiia bacterium]